MKLINFDEKNFGPIEGLENHPCDWSIEEEGGSLVIIWTCRLCPKFLIKSYFDDQPGVYRSGSKDDPEREKKLHHYGKCQPKFS
jgi:hypothetical protein